MRRRTYLATLASAAMGATAGCGSSSGVSAEKAPDAPLTASARRLADVQLPVARSALTPAIHSVIPAITEPAFASDWSNVSIDAGAETYQPRLSPDTPVIGLERDGTARAYPLGVLERHEVVNDTVPASAASGADPEALLVTYCPSCGSSMTAVREVRGQPSVFEVSHFLWRSNLVLRDRATDSLWSQILAGAIRGPATGEQLRLVPSRLVQWQTWKQAHPDTAVLLPPPLSKTVYATGGDDYEYGRFTDTAPIIGEDSDGQAAGRNLVIGVAADGAAVAYPFEAVASQGAVNDIVGDTPVVVAVGPAGTLVAYERRVDGATLRFRREDDRTLAAGGSRWLVGRGIAVDGPYEGTTLRRANDLPPLFQFAWQDFHPESRIYRA